MDLGGFRSPEYLALNPQGKMPLLVSGDMAIPESDTICRYLLTQYADSGPSFQPDHYKSNLVARIHDMYMTTIQGCLYKAAPPFGIYGSRKEAQAEFIRQISVVADIVNDDDGRYLLGDEVSYADAALFPTMVFAAYLFPKFVSGYIEDQILPKRLKGWYYGLIETDDVFRKVHDEILGGLQSWEEKDRWGTIHQAGARDMNASTLFDKIISGDIPANVVYQDTTVLAFTDINPAAPAHILVIPKDRDGLSSLRNGTPDHESLLGHMLVVAGKLASDKDLGFEDGGRLVINDGPDGGQEVPHLHMHVLGGRKLEWPPG
uniref:HIT domain-containing protein n=1 Tax=Proboscia inermis TaxID=420281 RepID=A0A7S0BWJ6_9STRA|mmetsp:Transcript_13137/g.13283  ORF Transcript_13137/g.13283 Transcript_13137/m.13283 type:complete len:318 (+) Transcript_13137:76-1029(+)